ncbi:MAG: Rieske (2Fe-2S) protein [Planctomycetota bacterium]|nr:Rieske (2Fe-2S) protein [Planctomycetota bacterium]
MSHSSHEKPSDQPAQPERRTFLTAVSSLFMAGGLAAGYGAFGAVAGRYLYPAKDTPRGWLYVARAADLKVGDALAYTAPSGATVAIARQDNQGEAQDFIALSSTCPHLGCKVHWEGQHQRFFCPCHNGAFDAQGMGIDGPPKGQQLARYPLKVENGLLFIEVPLAYLPQASSERPDGPEAG